MREDTDSLGAVSIPGDALYGANTMRGAENFALISRPISAYPNFVQAMARVKKATALANEKAGALASKKAGAIARACDEIIAGQHHDNFIVSLAEGSGGTSTNMNFNEVIANRAGQILGDPLGSFAQVNPNDHVNLSQSTNDVLPTAIKLACVTGSEPLLLAADQLVQSFRAKAVEHREVLRLGRTCMQAAQPMTYGQLFDGYAATVARALDHIKIAQSNLQAVPIGGTAIGTGLGMAPGYRDHIAQALSAEFGFPISLPEDYFDAMQAADGFSRFSGELKILSETIGKIASDLVILGSDSNSGLGEIILSSVQPGSSIMAGKVNPVIAMTVQQIAFMVQGNDATVSIAALSGQMEINHFEPVIAHALFNSLELLTTGCTIFRTKCIAGLKVDQQRSYANLASSHAISSVFLRQLGYKKVTELVKLSVSGGLSLMDTIVQEDLMSAADVKQALIDATKLPR